MNTDSNDIRTNFYHTCAKVYRTRQHYDSSYLLAKFRTYVKEQSSVLELGSGPGTDLKVLSKHYTITGSDYSPIFLEILEHKYPHIPLLEIDAVSIGTENRYDCLYSSKVLHHLLES